MLTIKRGMVSRLNLEKTMLKTIKVELDSLDLVTLIRVCHFVESDYRKLSDSTNLKYGERETFIFRAYELNRLASLLDHLYESQKVEG